MSPALASAETTNDTSSTTEQDDATDTTGPSLHPSGRDRTDHHDKRQGKAESDPDADGHGPDRNDRGVDKPGKAGGALDGDQDGNNGCGNDQDFEDDNEGWCGPPISPDDEPSDDQIDDEQSDDQIDDDQIDDEQSDDQIDDEQSNDDQIDDEQSNDDQIDDEQSDDQIDDEQSDDEQIVDDSPLIEQTPSTPAAPSAAAPAFPTFTTVPVAISPITTTLPVAPEVIEARGIALARENTPAPAAQNEDFGAVWDVTPTRAMPTVLAAGPTSLPRTGSPLLMGAASALGALGFGTRLLRRRQG